MKEVGEEQKEVGEEQVGVKEVGEEQVGVTSFSSSDTFAQEISFKETSPFFVKEHMVIERPNRSQQCLSFVASKVVIVLGCPS